jgi:hypothetical protein
MLMLTIAAFIVIPLFIAMLATKVDSWKWRIIHGAILGLVFYRWGAAWIASAAIQITLILIFSQLPRVSKL